MHALLDVVAPAGVIIYMRLEPGMQSIYTALPRHYSEEVKRTRAKRFAPIEHQKTPTLNVFPEKITNFQKKKLQPSAERAKRYQRVQLIGSCTLQIFNPYQRARPTLSNFELQETGRAATPHALCVLLL